MEAGFYVIKSVGASIGAGVSGAFEVELLGIGKTEVVEPYSLAGEFVCGQLAVALGLPAPPSTIAETSTGEKVFVSLRFSAGGLSFPPVDPAELVADRPTLAAGIVAFDAWVGNWDRHAGNIAYVRGVSGASIFDHGRTLLRTSTGQGAPALLAQVDSPHLYAQSALLPHLQSARDLKRWCERIESLAPELISDVCEAAARLDLITRAEAKAVEDFLRHRQGRMMDYLTANPASFPKITDWTTT